MQRANENLDITGVMLKDRMPLHFGGMSDPFSNRATTQRSRELLKILAEYDYPTVLSTKNVDELLNNDTLSLLKKVRYLIVQVSMSSSMTRNRIIEPGAPSTDRRIQALRMLSSEGIYTMTRLQPLFPDDIKAASQEIIPRLGNAGVRHVIVEFIKLPLEKNLSESAELFLRTGWNGSQYFIDMKALRVGREWILRPEMKWDLLGPLIEAIHANGMTYGAGDYGLNHLGDTDCCCGIDVVNGFSGYFRANIPHLIRASAPGHITSDRLADWATPEKSIKMYLNSQCREETAITLQDYLLVKWNRPGTENAPDTFLGVSWGGERDEKGNCVYWKERIL